MATLIITKKSNDSFSFVLDGDYANEVKNIRNDLLTVGNFCHFKTSNGSNIVKIQNITPSEVTIIDGATTYNPTTTDQLFNNLVSVGYFDWIYASGGSGASRFDELLDTFAYFGQNGKTVVVDEAQMKLVPATFYNVSKFTELSDVPNAHVPGKYVMSNGSELIFVDLPPAPSDSTKLDSGGYSGTGQDLSNAIDNLDATKANTSYVDAQDAATLAAANSYTDGVVSGKEDISNKTDDIETNKTSSVKYTSAKAIVTWILNFLFGNTPEKATPLVDGDTFLIGDYEDSGKTKKKPWSWVKSLFLNKSGEVLSDSIDFDYLLSQDESLEIRKRLIQPEDTRLQASNTTIVAWGDSLTAGAGSTGGLNYPFNLSVLTNFTVTNKGIGGETSTQIKNRMVADTGNYDKSVIIWAGRNNYSDPVTVKSDIATIVSTLTHQRYLVVGVINGEYSYEYKNNPGWTLITQLNADLKALYGEKFVDIREYLVSLHDSTTQGMLDYSRDIVPYNIRADQLHLNNQGYQYVSEFLNRRLNILFGKNDEYLQAKDFSYYNKLYSANSSILNQASSSQNANYWINGLGISDGGFISRNGTEAGFGKTHYRFQNNASTRFSWVLTGLETGSNAGSNLALICQNDSGTTLSNIVTFFRNTSNVLIRNGVGTPLDNGVDRLQVDGTILSAGFKKISGTSSQILMADGSVSTILSGSATLDFPSTPAQTSSELTISVPGASEGDVVSLGISNSAAVTNGVYSARVSATDTVTVKFNNYSILAIDPPSGTFKVKVFK